MTASFSFFPAVNFGALLAGIWIAAPVLGLRPLLGGALRYRERTEADQGNALAPDQGRRDGGSGRVERLGGGILGQAGGLGDMGDQFCFVHGSTKRFDE